MARKKQIEIQKEFEERKKLERYHELVTAGEALGDELIEKLARNGSSMEALVVETYALSKAYGALRAIADDKGFEAERVFEAMLPSFIEEMKRCL